MNSLFLEFDDGIDTNAVYTKVKELFPSVKKIILKEFTELAYKDHEMDVKFEFITPHTVKMIYHGNEWVSIEDEEFHFFAGEKTEDEAILEYICDLEYFWNDYIDNYDPDTMGKGLIKRAEKVKAKVKKIW